LKIRWCIRDEVIISEKDKNQTPFKW